MLRKLLSTIILTVACIAVSAQETCIINGNIADTRLADGKKIKKVYLTRTDEFGRTVEVASAKVKKGKFTFKQKIDNNAPVLLYTITGFGEGDGIGLFVEPGEVLVSTASAANPAASTVYGTPANDTYAQYKALLADREREVESLVAALEERNGNAWATSAEGKDAIKRLRAKEAIKTETMALRFLIENNASPMMPLEVERALLPKLTESYADQMVKSVAFSLQEHPYYESLRNKVLASAMKVGNEVPDIVLPLLNGDKKHLSDYRGKYVVLNFWSKGSEKSAAMIAELHNLYNVVKESETPFVIISIALESEISAWKNAVNANNMDAEGWLNACEGMGASSPAAKIFGAENAPKIVLVEPEGRAVSLDMDIDELVMRVEQIISGDLYYLDQEK